MASLQNSSLPQNLLSLSSSMAQTQAILNEQSKVLMSLSGYVHSLMSLAQGENTTELFNNITSYLNYAGQGHNLMAQGLNLQGQLIHSVLNETRGYYPEVHSVLCKSEWAIAENQLNHAWLIKNQTKAALDAVDDSDLDAYQAANKESYHAIVALKNANATLIEVKERCPSEINVSPYGNQAEATIPEVGQEVNATAE